MVLLTETISVTQSAYKALLMKLGGKARPHALVRIMAVLVLMMLALAPLYEAAANSANRHTWRPPPTPGLQDNLRFMKRLGDWQVTCYTRAVLAIFFDSCELRLHERQMSTGHQRALFVFDLVIEVAHPDNARSHKQGPRVGMDDDGDTMIEATDVYDFNILLAATPTPSWEDGQLRIGSFNLAIGDVCRVGECILRHRTAEQLVTQMLNTDRPIAKIQFKDAPLSNSFSRRQVVVPLSDFDRALNLLIEQTQIHSGY